MRNIQGDQAGAIVVLTTLLIVYVVGVLWGFLKRPRLGSVIELGMLLGVMYVGWTIRTWPTAHKGDGMLMSLLMAWRDSIITLVYLALKLVGLDDVWNFIAKFFEGARP